jgi:hypothetical protein
MLSEILHQASLLPNVLPWNQFRADSLSQLKLTEIPVRRLFQRVSTRFSFKLEIDLKALVQYLLPLVQDLSCQTLIETSSYFVLAICSPKFSASRTKIGIKDKEGRSLSSTSQSKPRNRSSST